MIIGGCLKDETILQIKKTILSENTDDLYLR